MCVCVCVLSGMCLKNDHACFTSKIHILSQEGEVFEARSGLQSMLQPCLCLRKQGLKEQPHIFTSKQLHSLESSRHGRGCKACYSPACVSENKDQKTERTTMHIHIQTVFEAWSGLQSMLTLTLAEYEHHKLLAPFPCSSSSWFS